MPHCFQYSLYDTWSFWPNLHTQPKPLAGHFQQLLRFARLYQTIGDSQLVGMPLLIFPQMCGLTYSE